MRNFFLLLLLLLAIVSPVFAEPVENASYEAKLAALPKPADLVTTDAAGRKQINGSGENSAWSIVDVAEMPFKTAFQIETKKRVDRDDMIQFSRPNIGDVKTGDVLMLGLESHLARMTPPVEILQQFDRYAEFGSINITEFDASVDDEQLQADMTRDYLTVCFSHPAVANFIMWGFWDGQHWRKNATIFRKDWSLKPSGNVYRDLVFKQWWTDRPHPPTRRAPSRSAASSATTSSPRRTMERASRSRSP
jgi:hypothetical protein